MRNVRDSRVRRGAARELIRRRPWRCERSHKRIAARVVKYCSRVSQYSTYTQRTAQNGRGGSVFSQSAAATHPFAPVSCDSVAPLRVESRRRSVAGRSRSAAQHSTASAGAGGARCGHTVWRSSRVESSRRISVLCDGNGHLFRAPANYRTPRRRARSRRARPSHFPVSAPRGSARRLDSSLRLSTRRP